MKYSIDKSFERDTKKAPQQILALLADTLASIHDVTAIMHIPGIKKLKGYKNCYRIKIDDYRLGLYITKDGALILSRLLPRKDIYKKFP